MLTTPGIISDQDGYTAYDDDQNGFPVGVTVEQSSYAYSQVPDNEYIILRLVVNNNDYYAKNIVLGMYFDWDLGASGDDAGNYDADFDLGYVYNNNSPGGLHVGTAVISAGGASSYRVYDLNVEGNLDYVDKYKTLTEGFQQTSSGPGDMRYYIAAGPYALAPAGQNNVEVAFAIVAGDSLADLQANVAAARAKYGTIAAVEDILPVGKMPLVFSLSQNYPNPFNPETRIRYGLPEGVYVRLAIYNLLGRKVSTLVDTHQPPGFHTILWDGSTDDGGRAASGVYIYRIEAGDHISSKKLLLLR